MSNESQVAEWADELTFDTATLTGGYDVFDSLDFNPVVMIIDNQSDTPVQLSINGTSTCRTFVAGQALTLDLSTNRATAQNYSFYKGKSFWVKGVAGVGNFTISFTYRVE